MRAVILGSGNGTNCRALLQAQSSDMLGSTKLVAVYSNIQNSGILQVAQDFDLFNSYLGNYNQNDEKKDNHWIKEVKRSSPDLIILAGFMRILSKRFIDSFGAKIINLHPSLLPSFRGVDAVKQAWDAGVKITGCTIHWVTSELDSGKIIAQSPVRILPSDSIELVRSKVGAAEHMLLPTVVAELSNNIN